MDIQNEASKIMCLLKESPRNLKDVAVELWALPAWGRKQVLDIIHDPHRETFAPLYDLSNEKSDDHRLMFVAPRGEFIFFDTDLLWRKYRD